MFIMRNPLIALSAAVALGAPIVASAQAASPHTVTGNMAIVSDYRFRGISQTFNGPAIQGGIDYSHSSGFYLGNWDSNVSGLSYNNGSSIEMDFYGGWRGEIGSGFTLDAGLLQYYYPNAKIVSATTDTKYDTLEAYIAGGWKWFTLKYSYATTPWFGVKTETFGGACNKDGVDCFAADPGSSKGSGYIDLSGSYELMPKLSLVAHIGNQKVKNYSKLDYTDWKIGLTYDLNGWALGAAYVDTNADEKWYYLTDGSGRTKELGKSTLVLSVSKSF
jgi:hypothetical protein